MADADNIVSGMAGRYASALFALAQEATATDRVGADLKRFSALLAESPDLRLLVRSPGFSADEQTRAISAVLDAARIDGLAANFLKLVASKRRLFSVERMISDFQALDERARGVTRADVTVAATLGDADLAALKDVLKGVTGGKSVEVAVKVDPAIIGGLVVRLGSRMVDGSIRTKLNAIRTRMKEVG